ncbi:unnamed protein product [Paramecium sonneborni]|uniref:Uncharacterized protein n=1 Tax=Paramecium sonneborni TaxID=65129 RepID=A0A8S1RML7_9CILI|nr:unnamed protein product [Paramecium sonneborni]
MSQNRVNGLNYLKIIVALLVFITQENFQMELREENVVKGLMMIKDIRLDIGLNYMTKFLFTIKQFLGVNLKKVVKSIDGMQFKILQKQQVGIMIKRVLNKVSGKNCARDFQITHIFEYGEYKDDFRIGKWLIIKDDSIMQVNLQKLKVAQMFMIKMA